MNADFKIAGVKIETERLVLRSFEAGELDDFYAYASVEGVGEMAGWKHHETLDETRRILDSLMEKDNTFAVCLKSQGRRFAKSPLTRTDLWRYDDAMMAGREADRR